MKKLFSKSGFFFCGSILLFSLLIHPGQALFSAETGQQQQEFSENASKAETKKTNPICSEKRTLSDKNRKWVFDEFIEYTIGWGSSRPGWNEVLKKEKDFISQVYYASSLYYMLFTQEEYDRFLDAVLDSKLDFEIKKVVFSQKHKFFSYHYMTDETKKVVNKMISQAKDAKDKEYCRNVLLGKLLFRDLAYYVTSELQYFEGYPTAPEVFRQSFYDEMCFLRDEDNILLAGFACLTQSELMKLERKSRNISFSQNQGNFSTKEQRIVYEKIRYAKSPLPDNETEDLIKKCLSLSSGASSRIQEKLKSEKLSDYERIFWEDCLKYAKKEVSEKPPQENETQKTKVSDSQQNGETKM